MPSQTIEDRLSELEAKVAQLVGKEQEAKQPASWLDRHFGAFKDNPDYDAAMEAGTAYRRAQPTATDEYDEAHAHGETDLSSGHRL